jgi:replicative DNA helicase
MADLIPANIEAEEVILGGILIDSEAVSRVIDLLKPEHFSISAHQTIYTAVCQIFDTGKPIDLMTEKLGYKPRPFRTAFLDF